MTLDPHARLDELEALAVGGHDGYGAPLDLRVRAHAETLFDALTTERLPPPYVYRSESGGLQAEWTFGSHEVSVELSPTRAYAHVVDVDSGWMDELRAKVSGARSLAPILAFVARFAS